MIKLNKQKLVDLYSDLCEQVGVDLPEPKLTELVDSIGSLVIVDLVENHFQGQKTNITEVQKYLKFLDDDLKIQSALQTLNRSLDDFVSTFESQLLLEQKPKLADAIKNISFAEVIDTKP